MSAPVGPQKLSKENCRELLEVMAFFTNRTKILTQRNRQTGQSLHPNDKAIAPNTRRKGVLGVGACGTKLTYKLNFWYEVEYQGHRVKVKVIGAELHTQRGWSQLCLRMKGNLVYRIQHRTAIK